MSGRKITSSSENLPLGNIIRVLAMIVNLVFGTAVLSTPEASNMSGQGNALVLQAAKRAKAL